MRCSGKLSKRSFAASRSQSNQQIVMDESCGSTHRENQFRESQFRTSARLGGFGNPSLVWSHWKRNELADFLEQTFFSLWLGTRGRNIDYQAILPLT